MDTDTHIALSHRHKLSGLNSHFNGEGLPFADYVRQTQAMLQQTHAGKADAEKIVGGNSPFGLFPTGDSSKGDTRPYQRGVLLTHGLSDSPYHMRHLAVFFQRKGFRVMALLLPGHGTQPGDLLEVRWQEWAKAVHYGVDRLADEVDELYLAGYSAGAALSVLHASRDERVRGLFLYSPALEITRRARWAGLHKLYSWLVPKSAWVNVHADRDPFKYESFSKNAALQMYRLTQALPKGAIDIPVFAAASADDATVHSGATLDFMRRETHPCRKLVWYATEKLEQQDVEWVDSRLPEQRILSSAHTAIVMPPNDPHYGERSDYANCLHYDGVDADRYASCLSGFTDVWLGEVNEQNLRHGVLRRLTWNPHYAAMEAAMQTFIERLP